MSRILITIPTWNEEVVIAKNLATLEDAVAKLLPGHDVRIEVADNGSTDRTRDIVRSLMAHGSSSVGLLEVHGIGKGIAIRRSWERHVGDADVLAFTDADLAADLSALPALVMPIAEGSADLVCGSRYVAGSRIERGVIRDAASNLYRALQRLILRLPVRDAQCGFKAISSVAALELLPLCREDGWLFDTELIALAARRGMRIAEIPVAWVEQRDPRRRSTLRLFRDGWSFLTALFRVRERVHR